MIFSFFRVNRCKSVSIRPFGCAQGMLIGNKHDLKKQSQLSRTAYCVLRTAKRSLKKQTQFAKGLNKRKHIRYKCLCNIILLKAPKNKANRRALPGSPKHSIGSP
jgi:hypothetical protein